MADSVHLEFLLKGRRAFKRWRRQNPEIRPDLSGSDLAGKTLVDYDFTDTNLRSSNLQEADLRRARLIRVDLSLANLARANLREVEFADVGGDSANLTGANLVGARFTNEYEGSPGAGFLELASVTGLETANFGTDEFLLDYLSRAFEYAHDPGLPEATFLPRLHEMVLGRLRLLESILSPADAATGLVDTIEWVDEELLRRLTIRPDELYQMAPRRFEELVAELLRSRGWEVFLTASTRDGGFDILGVSRSVDNTETRWLVECKRYARDRPVDVSLVRSLYGTRYLLGASDHRLMFATTSRFTQGAVQIATSRYDLDLRDYSDIVKWIRERVQRSFQL